ncbi:MAG: hypothetical protein K9M56_07140 [Victivallales bacterium]|nr:hypothetical protein [Victivallales bacterium]
MKNYLINKTEDFSELLENSCWKNADEFCISNWPWHKNEAYTPPIVSGKALYSNNRLYIKFKVKENFTKAVNTCYQDMVCRDSCVEFFVMCNNKEYFNFEVNAIGTLLLCFGKDRHNRTPISDKDATEIIITTSLPKRKLINAINLPEYQVACSIPFSLFTKYSKTEKPVSSTLWNGNFYKCGDLTPEPSWGCWAPIKTEKPDFHRPEYFEKLIFV